MQVFVRDNNVDQALKALKRKMQREGVFREMKLRKHYEKPSERKVRERSEAIRRARNLGRQTCDRWIAQHGEALGQRSTLDVQQLLPGHIWDNL